MLYVSEREFRSTLSALQELIEAGAVKVLVSPGLGAEAPVRFVFRQEQAEVDEMISDRDLTFRDFRRAADDIADVVNAAIHDSSEERFADVRADDRRAEALPEDPALARTKLRLVRDALDISALKRRWWVKRTAKTRILVGFQWDVERRVTDDDVKPPEGGGAPFAVLRIQASSAGAPALSLFSDAFREVTLTVDKEDVAAMKDTLDRLSDALSAEHQRDEELNG